MNRDLRDNSDCGKLYVKTEFFGFELALRGGFFPRARSKIRNAAGSTSGGMAKFTNL